MTSDISRFQVPVDKLRWRLDPSILPFDSTSELDPLVEIIGQDRGVEAFRFGMAMEKKGYNIFVTGPAHVGKQSMAQRLLKKFSRKDDVPDDLCYVNNFKDPDAPVLLRFKAGRRRGRVQARRERVPGEHQARGPANIRKPGVRLQQKENYRDPREKGPGVLQGAGGQGEGGGLRPDQRPDGRVPAAGHSPHHRRQARAPVRIGGVGAAVAFSQGALPQASGDPTRFSRRNWTPSSWRFATCRRRSRKRARKWTGFCSWTWPRP